MTKHTENMTKLELALRDLFLAHQFYAKVARSSPDERIAVGNDAIQWILKAARKVVDETPEDIK